MSQELIILLGAAATIGVVHTLLGPDHYLPFVAMSRARRWSTGKTAAITALCGLGHVAGSVVLGLVGIAAGITLKRLDFIESARGEVAAWLLIAFGLVYGVWGVARAVRSKPHTHNHFHADGTRHEHKHTHSSEHAHVHESTAGNATAWTLFLVFVLGPCEPLIPLLMFPAAAHGAVSVVAVAAVFATVTIATMTAVVLLSMLGLRALPATSSGRYGHAIAGAVILLCGVAIHMGL
jgi:ABC-type nickel/cobalt efflux system permease component RcnA